MGRVVNLEAAGLLFRRVLDNLAVLRSPLLGECLVAGLSFSSTNSVVSAGLTFFYGLAWLDNDGLKVR